MARTFAPHQQTTPALQRRKAALLARLQPPSGVLRASYVKQYLTCGKPNCRCRRGFKHGPFYYLVQCLGTGRVRKFLLKTPAQRKQARAGIAAHLKWRRQLAELSEINTGLLRRGAADESEVKPAKCPLFAR
jgi:hypothetical protein